jgi:hypothetical protein
MYWLLVNTSYYIYQYPLNSPTKKEKSKYASIYSSQESSCLAKDALRNNKLRTLSLARVTIGILFTIAVLAAVDSLDQKN